MVISISTTTHLKKGTSSRTGSITLNSPTPPTSPTSPTAPTNTSFPNVDSGQDATVASKEDHSFCKPENASRSPCPALNALANHGYLPRDGRDISFGKIVDSLEKGFNLSHGFAIFMAVGTFTLLRRSPLKPFDLEYTYRHNLIEHNASLAHPDVPDNAKFGDSRFDVARFKAFLDKAHTTPSSNGEEVFTSIDIAKHRMELQKMAPSPLDAVHGEIGRAEFAMVMEIFGKGKDREVSKKDVDTLVEDERIPDGWKPTHTLKLEDVVARSKEIREYMTKMRDALEQAENPGKDDGVIAHVIHHLKIQAKTISSHM